ncbi:hypothetical protein ACFFGV_03980 [Pontibacillus salicampi]|uniref:DUF4183 domain-containing protein n=1 Tax=Pontibacillus salicampi TaxID=1449801 RepID=A0ABV6LKD2_9BACI
MGAPSFCEVNVSGDINGVPLLADPLLVLPADILNNVQVNLLNGVGTITLNGIPCPTIDPVVIELNLLGLAVGTIVVNVTEVP